MREHTSISTHTHIHQPTHTTHTHTRMRTRTCTCTHTQSVSCSCLKRAPSHLRSSLVSERYDKAASEKCKADIETYCKDARTAFRGEAAVLKCLVSMFDELQVSGWRCARDLCAHVHAHCLGCPAHRPMGPNRWERRQCGLGSLLACCFSKGVHTQNAVLWRALHVCKAKATPQPPAGSVGIRGQWPPKKGVPISTS